MENKSVYRQSSLDRIQSPEQLNCYLRVTNPSAWTTASPAMGPRRKTSWWRPGITALRQKFFVGKSLPASSVVVGGGGGGGGGGGSPLWLFFSFLASFLSSFSLVGVVSPPPQT